MGEDRVKSQRMAFFIMGWIGMLFYFAQRWIFGPLIPSLMQEFSADKTTLGIVGSASLWGYMFIPIMAGLISDRFGRKNAILFGIFGFSTLTIVSGLVNSANQLFWSRFFTGTVEAFYFVPIAAFTLELFPEKPAFFLGLLISGSSVGWFVGPAVAGWLLDITGTWRTAFIVIGLAGLGVAFLQWWFWPQAGSKARTGVFFDRVLLLPKNLLMLFFLGLVLTFQMASEFGFSMWFPVYLRTEVMMSATGAGLLAGFFGIGQALGRPTMGFVADRMGYRVIGLAGSILMGGFFVLSLWVTGTPLKALFTFAAGFIGAAATGGLWTFTGLVFTSFKGLALGVIVTFAYCASSLSPIAIGYIGDHHSIGAALWMVTVPCAFAAGITMIPTFLLKRSRRHESVKDKP
jgi:YNFM family putative membrane transporter